MSPAAVVSQPYQTDVNTAHVIAGNSGVLACVIPSFVADFVSVQAWTEAGGATHFEQKFNGKHHDKAAPIDGLMLQMRRSMKATTIVKTPMPRPCQTFLDTTIGRWWWWRWHGK